MKFVLSLFFISIFTSIMVHSAETFDPGLDDIYIININNSKKMMDNGCNDKAVSANHVISRVGKAKRGELNEFDQKYYNIIKSDQDCQWGVLKNNKFKEQPRKACRDILVEEKRKIVILKIQDADDSESQAIIAGKDNCTVYLRQSLLNGYSLR